MSAGVRLVSWSAVALLVTLVAGDQAALACSCVGPTGAKAAKGADTAFRGRVVSVLVLEDEKKAKYEPKTKVEFEVSRVWKGKVRKRLVVRTHKNAWTCKGFSFAKGQEYLVFINKGAIGICNGTMVIPPDAKHPLWTRAKKALDSLGAGRKPPPR